MLVILKVSSFLCLATSYMQFSRPGELWAWEDRNAPSDLSDDQSAAVDATSLTNSWLSNVKTI